MLVFIDESGDPGFRIVRGSSSHFVIAMVIFDDTLEAERASTAIAAARDSLRVKPEFKFTKSHRKVRDGFFGAVAGFRFRVRALIVDKAAVYSDSLREDSDRFYNYFVRQLLSHDHGALTGANIKIDGSGDAAFKKELNAYLRRQLREGQVSKFRFADSRRDNLLQLADMCAGAILRARRGDAKQDGGWLRVLQRAGRIENLWDFR